MDPEPGLGEIKYDRFGYERGQVCGSLISFLTIM